MLFETCSEVYPTNIIAECGLEASHVEAFGDPDNQFYVYEQRFTYLSFMVVASQTPNVVVEDQIGQFFVFFAPSAICGLVGLQRLQVWCSQGKPTLQISEVQGSQYHSGGRYPRRR